MSVDYRVFYGYGYKVSKEKLKNLDPDKYDAFFDSNWIQCLDGYADESDYFFGIQIYNIDGCELQQIPVDIKIKHEDIMNMLNEYRNIFGKSGMAHHYVGFAVT